MPAMRFIMSALSLVAILAAVPALAQDSKAVAVKPEVVKESTPGPLATGEQRLDSLFTRLKRERSTEQARGIANEIREVFSQSGSATVDFLMESSARAMNDKRYGAALDFLDQVTLLKPDYIEGWNRRATLYYMKHDYGRALADIREVLKREPRHFGALAGLGLILQDVGDDKQALEVYRRALAVYPRLQRIPDVVKKLKEQVEGRDI